MTSLGVQLHIQDHHVVMNNGILQVTLSKPGGIVTGIQYNGIDNLLEVLNEEANRGYWDLVWSKAGSIGTTGTFDRIIGTKFSVIVESEEQVEISFTREWNHKDENVPLNIDKRFIMLRNSSGFYSYAIYEHLKEWPPFNLPQTRITFKLRKEKFQYMAIADNRQRYMPLPDDRLPDRCQILNSDFPEAVLLVAPIEPQYKGEVDDKYQYSCENQNLQVHGWICMEPQIGFWQITPSDEFRSGGPLKQNLTSHVGPVCLAMFLSAHYTGEDLVLKLKQNEPWKKVFGPVFIYLNSASDAKDSSPLWNDAKKQMMNEVQSWPYEFPASNDFPPSKQRGNVSGRIRVRDRY
ncbi:hypothetical protein M0R45_027159 [Rubus argutus]|uniref:Uncharacterized protein n=1 Tax=Rubus argutus TaxID=59490 RepID=A0AAW1X087_RUBAR